MAAQALWEYLNPLVQEDIIHHREPEYPQECGCHYGGETYFLCDYHDGFASGVDAAEQHLTDYPP